VGPSLSHQRLRDPAALEDYFPIPFATSGSPGACAAAWVQRRLRATPEQAVNLSPPAVVYRAPGGQSPGPAKRPGIDGDQPEAKLTSTFPLPVDGRAPELSPYGLGRVVTLAPQQANAGDPFIITRTHRRAYRAYWQLNANQLSFRF
jgi:hypothetical protein